MNREIRRRDGFSRGVHPEESSPSTTTTTTTARAAALGTGTGTGARRDGIESSPASVPVDGSVVGSFVRSSASYATMVSTPFVGSNERTLPSRLSGKSNDESHASSSSRRCTRRNKPNNLSHSLIHTRTRARPRRYFVSSSTRTASSSGSPRARPSTPSSPRCVSPPPPIDPPPGTTH